MRQRKKSTESRNKPRNLQTKETTDPSLSAFLFDNYLNVQNTHFFVFSKGFESWSRTCRTLHLCPTGFLKGIFFFFSFFFSFEKKLWFVERELVAAFGGLRRLWRLQSKNKRGIWLFF